MDDIFRNSEEDKDISSDSTDVSTPRDFSNEDSEKKNTAEDKDKRNLSFKERIEFAKEHLQRIEMRKEIIDHRQVILCWILNLISPFNYCFFRLL